MFHLRKATRCFLYGLFDPSAALCKECLEEALKTKLFASTQGIEALVKEPKRTDRGTPRGELERFISAGAAIALLDGPSRTSADQIRQHGNQVMHDRPVLKEAEARQDLDDVRGVLNQLFAW